jgi:hypothetical protein
MFRHHRARVTWLSMLIVPGLLWIASDPVGAASGTSCGPAPKLDRAAFPGIPKIDNKFLPLVPGMQLVLDGYVTEDDGLQHPHRIETTVTDLTKVIDGVRTIVVFDRDIEDGELIESELFFQAQAGDGTVWLLGEYPEEYESGTLMGAPSTWVSSVSGAKAGIAMLAKPTVGTTAYLQGVALKVGFMDCAVVFATGQQACVPVRCYDNVMVTDEWAPLDLAGGHQRKFYAPGVGNVQVAAAGGADPEILQLTKAAKLCGGALAKVRKLALAQDSRGYTVATSVYGKTPPAQNTLATRAC